MICIYAKECNSETCLHRVSHTENDFCKMGSCSWGKDTMCIVESTREKLTFFLHGLFPDEQMKDVVDAIEAIYGKDA